VKISSPLGDYDYHVERVAFHRGRLEVVGRLGQWQTTTIVEPADLRSLLRKTTFPLLVGGGLVAVTRWLRRV
jgi:hypothetical protein